jgi:hypothetical protein
MVGIDHAVPHLELDVRGQLYLEVLFQVLFD